MSFKAIGPLLCGGLLVLAATAGAYAQTPDSAGATSKSNTAGAVEAKPPSDSGKKKPKTAGAANPASGGAGVGGGGQGGGPR